MIDINKIRNEFPMLKGNKMMQGHKLVYLDNASTTFKPYSVIKAVDDYYKNLTANSHRGDYDLCFKIDQMINDSRLTIAKFINAKSEKEVVFTSGASMSINLVAYGYALKYLKEDDEIIIDEAEHASNVLPWFRVSELTGCKIKYIPLTEEGRITPENLRKVITDKTKIVAVACVTNVYGFICDIKEMSKIAHEHGALLACDGAQSVPHIKTDVQDLDCDFLSFSGHKMCGPTGIGVLYGKFDLLSKMDPLMTGGGMNAKFSMCGDARYLTPPSRFEAGTQNIEGILGIDAACRFINHIGIENIEEHEKEIRAYAIKKMKQIDDIIIYNETAEGGIITFNVNNVFAQDEATYLNSRGICARSGQHCAKILVDHLGTVATVRISFYFYTTKDDIDALIDALKNKGGFLDAYFN